MQVVTSILTLVLCALFATAQTKLSDEIRFPIQYTGEFQTQSRVNDGPLTKQTQRGTFDESWVRMDIHLVIDGVGESLQQARFGSYDESLILIPSSYQVSRTNRFQQTHTDAGEINLTPMPILRNLAALSSNPSRSTNADGTITLDVPELQIASTGKAEVILDNDQIIEYREGPLDNEQWALVILYQDWKTLPSGNHIPTVIQTETQIGPERILFGEATLVAFTETNHTSSDRKLDLPQEFTVIDHIDGVTKNANGEVIAPIEYGNANNAPQRPLSQSPMSKQNIFIGLGICMLLGVCFVWRANSKQAP